MTPGRTLKMLFLSSILLLSTSAASQPPGLHATIALEDDARSTQTVLLQTLQADLGAIGAIAMGPIGDLERSEISSRVRAAQTALVRLTQSLHQVHAHAAIGTTEIHVRLPLEPTPVVVDEPFLPADPPETVMGTADFQKFMHLWKGASFESERRSLLEAAFGKQQSRVGQILAMLKELNFESEKIATVEYLAPHMAVDDRPKAYQLMEAMQFPSTKTRLQEILEAAFKSPSEEAPR
jgi:plasmid stability protein